jgi:tRNA threonylcarbamoyladenosine biosynthesis protein TsaE
VIRAEAPDAAATEALGARIAVRCAPGLTLHLAGDLGAGKTTFARGFLHGLGHVSAVRSPTYTLVECYETPHGRVFHFDLYRLADPGELEALGFRDYFDGSAICLVEWPERAGPLLGPPDLKVTLAVAPGGGRIVTFEADTEAGRRLVTGAG